MEINENTTTIQKIFTKSIAATAILTSFILPNHSISSNNLLSNRSINNTSSSSIGDMKDWLTPRQNRVRSIRGKYAHVATSSRDFAERKHRELDEEE